MTPNIENLKKLHDIVASVPDDHFNMETYFDQYDRFKDPDSLDPNEVDAPIQELMNRCGTVGCVVGWGAMDRELNPDRLDYAHFSHSVLGISPSDTKLWMALFDSEWGATGSFGEPIVDPVDQKNDALNRLNTVIKEIEADPNWMQTEHYRDWLHATLLDMERICMSADDGDDDPDDDY